MKRNSIHVPGSGAYILCFQRDDEDPVADVQFFDGDRSIDELKKYHKAMGLAISCLEQWANEGNRYVMHPNAINSPSPQVFGRLLRPGEVLEASDIYASTDGKWERCPCPGLKIGDEVQTLFVRPASYPGPLPGEQAES